MAVTFDNLMQGFGVVTVMNACIFNLKGGKSYTATKNCYTVAKDDGTYNDATAGLAHDAWDAAGEYIDTLKIANFTMEGPTKTVTGGQYANPIIKYGKTMTAEIQDALGRAATMERFFGCAYDKENKTLSVTDKFPGPFAIEGDTYFIDQKTGEKKHVFILIPQFIPDAIMNLTQDAEGDATVFDLNGTIAVTTITEGEGADAKSRDIFYEIRETSFFKAEREELQRKKEHGVEDLAISVKLNGATPVKVALTNVITPVTAVINPANEKAEIGIVGNEVYVKATDDASDDEITVDVTGYDN